MALPVLTDTEMDGLINARIKPFLVEIAQHQLNAVAQGDELDAATTAHTAASTAATRARLRAAVAALKSTRAAIATLADAATALDRLAAGTLNSATRVRNRAGQAMTAGETAVIPAEPAP